MNNYSKQREIILETLKSTNTHPTAEELYHMVHEKYTNISKSTVYRNVNILVENDSVQRIKMQSGADRFDYIYKKHYHAICERCGKVFDFIFEFDNEKLKKMIQAQTGIIANTDSIMIYGVCKECKSK